MKFKFTPFFVLMVFLAAAFTADAQVNKRDSLALVDLYKNTNGPNWSNHNGWLSGAVSTWYGITTDSNKTVTGIDLSANRLAGTIPGSIDSLTKLTVLNLANNYLNFNGLENLSNKFNFVVYSPQQKLRLAQPGVGRLTVSAGGTITNNTYRWYNGSALIKTATGDSTFSYSSAGNYFVAVTNPTVTGLTLYSEVFYVTVSPVVQDSLALVDLYNNTNGPNWLRNDNWLAGQTKTWYGITLDTTGRVAGINLSSNGLNGDITGSFNTLTNLQNVNFVNNSLTFNTAELALKLDSGAIYAPQDTILPIHLNNGMLAVSAGGTASNNTYKWYRDSVLTKTIKGDSTYIPGKPGNYSVIVTNSVATALTLTSTTLTINKPQLAPIVLDSLALVDLYDSTNGPGWFGKAGWLTPAPLSEWYGVHLGKDSAGFDRVTALYLNFNNLTGHLPMSFYNLSALGALDFGSNHITDTIPSAIGNLRSLTYINLTSNNFSGKIPASLGYLTKLYTLLMSQNQLSGSIPEGLGNLVNLQTIKLFQNKLSGNIPATLGNLINLQSLQLSSNQLSGSVPSELGNLINLQSLQLDNNQLSGSIPSGLGNLANLQSLRLSTNQLSGPIAVELGNLTSLTDFELDSNHLTGNIPTELGNLTNLNLFSVSGNLLTGVIPQGFGNIQSFNRIVVARNHLSGIMPAFISATPPTLDITNNYFTYDGLLSTNAYLSAIPQDTILPVHYHNNKLSVWAGGTLVQNKYTWFRNGVKDTVIFRDSTYAPLTVGLYKVVVTVFLSSSPAYGVTLYSDTFAISDHTILPAKPATEYASYETTDTTGWTHYYYNNNTPNDFTDDTLLLSLKKYGQDIGTIGDGTFSVKLVATSGAGSNTGIHLTNPLITNSSGYWVMNRYWQVTPTHEPGESVGVRFYYNNKDLADVNGSYPNHNLTNDKLIFYKTVGGNPDPTTNLAGATAIISIMPGTAATDTTWTYHALSDTTQYGEYSVASFSGGGGGGTGNNLALPVVLVNFTGNLAKNDVQLNWQTAQEINAGYYTVERSLTGRDYTAVGRINAAGNSTIAQAYKLTDYNAALLGSATLYYRLKISDKNGYTTYSKVIAVNIAGGVSGLLVYPNPAKNTATVIFYANEVNKFIIEITDITGKTIKRIEDMSAAGTNKVIVDLHGYPQGTYMITLKGTNIKQQNITLLKQ